MWGIKNTKENRLKILSNRFESLIKEGFVKEIYKDLTIFTMQKESRFLLQVFKGTGTNNINKYYYRTEERRNEAINEFKKSSDYREQRRQDEKGNKKLSSHAAAAKAIREELKKEFPGVSFSVTSESFSMGNSVHISWTDGAIREQVEKFTGKYQYGHFDGMTDMYEYTNSRDDIPQAKYIQESRSMSKETENILLPFAKAIFDETNGFGCHNAENLLYRIFCKTSFPIGAKPTGIKRTEITCGQVDEWYKITFDTDKEPEPETTNDAEEYIDFEFELLTTTKEAEEETTDKQQAKIDEYNNRKAAKAERFKELAEKARKQSDQAFNTAKQIGDFIPMGQPILVGHHSEGRHRRDLAKIDNNMRKSIELDKKAEYYENKAENAENSNVISSDDPEAITKLKNKLAGLEKNQELMKEANKIIRNRFLLEVEKVEQLEKIGLTQKQAIEIMRPDHFGGQGFASFSLTNNNANMQTVKKRIEQLEKLATLETKEFLVNGVKVVDNTEANRLQIFFNSIPDEATRTELKRNGFRWSPFNKCWQSYRNQYQFNRAKTILNQLQ